MHRSGRTIILMFTVCFGLLDVDASDTERLIVGFEPGRILFDDGGHALVSETTEVIKKGYDLRLQDLRPGWAVTLPLSSSPTSYPVTKVTVAAIPAVRNFPGYRGLRDAVAVARAELGFMPAIEALESVDVQQAVETLTAAVLGATGRFIVVDMGSRDEVLNEQDFSHSGYGNAENSPREGRMATASYLVKVAIVDFDHATRTGGGGGAFGIKVAKNKARSKLTMRIRLVDASTGIVVADAETTKSFGADALQVRVNLSETAESLVPFSGTDRLNDLERLAAAGISIAHNGFVKSPIGELFSLAINELVEKLMTNMGEKPWRSVIVNVLGPDQVVVRGGTDAGMAPGTILAVLRSSDPLVDPETGEELGSMTVPAGKVQVTEVQEKFSIARVTAGAGLRRGDLCLLAGGR